MDFGIETTELIYLLLGPGALLLAALLLRTDLRLKARLDTADAQLAEAQDRILSLERRLLDAERDSHRDVAVEQAVEHAVAPVERRLERVERQQEQLMLHDSETGPYLQAVRHAAGGADVEALVEMTGVTRAEAELIVALRRGAG